MNKITAVSLATVLFSVVANGVETPAVSSQLDYKGPYTEEKLICGATVTTTELHNVSCGEGCSCIADRKWCFKPSNLEVTTPNER